MNRTSELPLRWSAAAFPSTDPDDLRVIVGYTLTAGRGRTDALAALTALLARPFPAGDLTLFCSVTIGDDHALVAVHGAPDVPVILRRIADSVARGG